MEICALTDTGKVRASNQDYIYASARPVGPLPNLFLLADGMGGASAGDYASRFFVEKLVSFIGRQPDRTPEVAALRQGIIDVNRRLYQESIKVPALRGMGTTAVAATVSEGILYVANVGDSRLYLIRRGIIQVTRDHSYVEEMVSLGLMERESLDYKKNKNYITRAVGTSETIDIDFFEVSLQLGDQILLCSDGLTNMIDDDSIYAMISGQGSLDEKGRRLIEAANERGGADNISVILAEPAESEVTPC